MSRRQRGLLVIVLLVSLAAVGLHLVVLQTVDAPPSQVRKPDFYIEQPAWQLFDRKGRLSREMQAGRLEQWPGEPQAQLTEPRLRLTDRRQQVWKVRAEHGWMAENERNMIFDKQVRLQRDTAGSNLDVTTEQLRIAANGDLIETDQPVVLTAGSWHFSAMGLRAELDRQQLELLGKVRGIHD